MPSKVAPKVIIVSTHSRPKAAGKRHAPLLRQLDGFNTQPPEGGWAQWLTGPCPAPMVSTHSRPKAAGNVMTLFTRLTKFQHTAARRRLVCEPPESQRQKAVSTHSRPKAAGLRGHIPTI